MRVAYFDCPTGASGNMILGAMVDAGLPLPYLKRELSKLKIKGYEMICKKVMKNGFSATHLDVKLTRKEPSRTINDIYSIIKKSKLSKGIKEKSISIFKKLYEAESRVHGSHHPHIHEVGATDALIDVVGSVIGFEKLSIKEIYSSALPIGKGSIRHHHGSLPNPAPATTFLLKGVPVYKKNIKAELVTPTGAAIITSNAVSYDAMPKMEIRSIGLGAGTFDLPEANIIRLFIGESNVQYDSDLIYQIETNIDNMNPEFYEYIINKLMKSGALDAYISPIQMKKQRPGVTLTVLADIKDKDKLLKAIFAETTTLGVRTYLVKRQKLERIIKKIKTKYGIVRVKIGKIGNNILNVSPEYEDCVKLSKKTGIPIKIIYDNAKNQIAPII